MPKDISSPFTPGLPVPMEFFIGRRAESKAIERQVTGCQDGRPRVVFLTGERGIGKSSLASFVRHYTQRRNEVLGVHTLLGGVQTLEEMARRVFDKLVKESAANNWFERLKEVFSSHIQTVDIFGIGVEFSANETQLATLVRGFSQAIQSVLRTVSPDRKSLFLVLDDINGLASSQGFADWLKSLIDDIAVSQKKVPLCICMVGLEERRRSLIQLQPSLSRIFDVVNIRSWAPEETESFFQDAFARVGKQLDNEALKLFVNYTGGMPVLAHELGDAAFNLDEDERISREDALRALVIAAENVGRKYLEPQVIRAIRSDRYKSILKRILGTLPSEFRRSEVIGELDRVDGRVLDNFLRRMRDLGVVESDGAGAYRFKNELHRLYLGFVTESLAVRSR